MSRHWERAIILVDMNAFFASIEQLDHPELRGRPIGVTNGVAGTCIITSSYEARAYGIKTGMRIREAHRLCPGFIQVPSRPERYVRVSTAIMEALTLITPDVEIFSVDEAFLDVTHCQRLLGSPQQIARQVKHVVWEVSGISCSVGVSGDKTTAKWAARQHKPDGLMVVPPWQAAARLHSVPVTELCGIAGGIGRFLAERGVHTCGDMGRLPVSELARRFGNPGRRIWLMAQGLDPSPVETRIAPPKSIGHGKVLPPRTRSAATIHTYLEHMAYKVAARLRRHGLLAQRFFIGLRAEGSWLGGTYQASVAIDDAGVLAGLCRLMVHEHWAGEPVGQVQVTALEPQSAAAQLELFAAADGASRQCGINAVMDAINQRYGDFSLVPASLLKRSAMPDVIAPAWKPQGHRKTV